eukprot:gene12517-biopygen6871
MANEWMYQLANRVPNPWEEYNVAARFWIDGHSDEARHRSAPVPPPIRRGAMTGVSPPLTIDRAVESRRATKGEVADAMELLHSRIIDGAMPSTVLDEVVATPSRDQEPCPAAVRAPGH